MTCLGIVNQVSKFIPNAAELTQPLRKLLVRDNIIWSVQETAFQQIRIALIANPILALLNLNYEIVVSTDASCHGLGADLHIAEATR